MTDSCPANSVFFYIFISSGEHGLKEILIMSSPLSGTSPAPTSPTTPPPTNTTSPPPTTPSNNSCGILTGAVVGIVIGGVLILTLLSIIFICCKKKKRRSYDTANFYVPPPPPPKGLVRVGFIYTRPPGLSAIAVVNIHKVISRVGYNSNAGNLWVEKGVGFYIQLQRQATKSYIIIYRSSFDDFLSQPRDHTPSIPSKDQRNREGLILIPHVCPIQFQKLVNIKMAGTAAVRLFIRSTSVRSAAARLSSGVKTSPIRLSATKPLSHRIFRCPVELSVCLETVQPFQAVTSSALMNSMLIISRRSYGCLPEGS
ncbi:hypothetical protein L6452_17279 [Arctium lappa]|uniref:Uncharacterized protein n=1 Tax=Arctium lappa TaxID=4217 RepID=A0ACB9C343_ARCLA|nr:hypothetical protein L6452_17279 [Arctium lappa]